MAPCFIGTLSGMQVVGILRSCHPHKMRVVYASPQSTCADGAALQVGSWTDSVSAEAHHWTGRRSEQKLGAWFPGSQTGPAGTSNMFGNLEVQKEKKELTKIFGTDGTCRTYLCAVMHCWLYALRQFRAKIRKKRAWPFLSTLHSLMYSMG